MDVRLVEKQGVAELIELLTIRKIKIVFIEELDDDQLLLLKRLCWEKRENEKYK